MPEVKPRVFIEQDDGRLRQVELPAELARRAAVYGELRSLNLSLEEIEFVLKAQLA
jgi:hypothetical protein